MFTLSFVICSTHILPQVAFQLSSTGHVPPMVTPEQIGTQVLKYLLDITAEYLGHDQVSREILYCLLCFVGYTYDCGKNLERVPSRDVTACIIFVHL